MAADPSPDNVPYHPAHHLTIASKPLAEHDFVMVAGYPGQTQRVTTYSEVAFDVEWTYPQRIELLQEAYDALEKLGKAGGMTAIKANIVSAIDVVAARLGNTRAVCRSAYIHPAVLLGYESGELCLFDCDEGDPGLDADERWALAFLREVGETARRPEESEVGGRSR